MSRGVSTFITPDVRPVGKPFKLHRDTIDHNWLCEYCREPLLRAEEVGFKPGWHAGNYKSYWVHVTPAKERACTYLQSITRGARV